MAENAGKLEILVIANLAAFAKELKPRVDAIAEKVRAKIVVLPDGTGLQRKLRELVKTASASAENFKIPIDVVSDGLRRKVTEAVTGAGAGEKVTVGTDLDAKTLPAKVRAEKKKAQKAAGTIKIPIKLDVKQAGGDLAKVVALLKFPAVAAAIGPVVTLVGALGAGLVALVSAAAPAVGVVGLVPAAVSALIQGFVGAKLATGGLADAFKEVSSAEEKLRSGQKLTTDEVGKLNAALRNVSPAGRQFVEIITRLRPAFTGLRKEVQQQFFSKFAGQINGLARQALPILRSGLSSTGAVLGRFVAGLGRAFSHGGVFFDLKRILATNNTALGYFGQAITLLFRSLINVLVVAGPLMIRFSKAVARTAAAIFSFTTVQRSSGGMAKFFERSATVAAQLGRILRNLAVTLFGVGRAATPLGQTLLNTLERATARFAEFTRSVSGQNKLRAYFDSVRPALREVGLLVDAVAGGLVRMSSDKSLAPLLNQLRTQLGPALSTLFQNLSGSFGPALVTALTAVVNLVSALSAGGGGGLTSFLTTITSVINALTSFINTVPGASRAITVFFAAAGASKALLGVAGIVGGAGKAIFGLGKNAVIAGQGMLGLGRGLLGITGSKAPGVLQKIGIALRVNIGLGLQAAASSAVSAATSVFRMVAAIRFATIATALWTAAQWLLNIALDANPIGLVIISTAALVAGIILLIKYWRQVSDFFLHSRVAIAVVTVAFGALALAALLVIRHWRPVVAFFVSAWQAITSAVLSAVDVVVGVAQVGFGALAAAVRVAMNVIGTVVSATMTVVGVVVTAAMAVARFAVAAFATVLPVITAVLGLFRAIFYLVFQVVRLIVVSVMAAVYLAIVGTLLLIQTAWNAAWARIQFVVTTAWQAIKFVVGFAMAALGATISAGMAVLSTIWNALWGRIKFVATQAWAVIRSVVTAGANVVRAVVSSVVGAISAIWSGFWGSSFGRVVSAGISNALGAVRRLAGIVATGAKIVADFASGIARGMVGALKAITDWVTSAAGAVGGLVGRFFNAGVEMVSALIRGVTSKIEAAGAAIKRLADKVTGFLPGSPVKEGPLKVLNRGRAGRSIVRMIADGVDAERSRLAQAASRLAGAFSFPVASTLAGGGVGAVGGALSPSAVLAAGSSSRVNNLTINAAPDVPTAQQVLRALSYAEAMHA